MPPDYIQPREREKEARGKNNGRFMFKNRKEEKKLGLRFINYPSRLHGRLEMRNE